MLNYFQEEILKNINKMSITDAYDLFKYNNIEILIPKDIDLSFTIISSKIKENIIKDLDYGIEYFCKKNNKSVNFLFLEDIKNKNKKELDEKTYNIKKYFLDNTNPNYNNIYLLSLFTSITISDKLIQTSETNIDNRELEYINKKIDTYISNINSINYYRNNRFNLENKEKIKSIINKINQDYKPIIKEIDYKNKTFKINEKIDFSIIYKE